MKIDSILNICNIEISSYEQVTGGDISEAFCVHTWDKKYFLKVNSASLYPAMFEKEADGLQFFVGRTTLKVPQVIACGKVKEHQYLLLEWLDTGKPSGNFWENFAVGLATLHKITSDNFGWKEDNYIGSLVQKNNFCDSWAEFYYGSRLNPLARHLYDAGIFEQRDLQSLEHLCKQLGSIFPNEPPALIHGDLWSGNFLTDVSGNAAVFDPAIHFGHREMDLGMARLFGGFDHLFYETYNEVFPLASGWEKRIALTQLYPILVHAVLFGGQYIQSAREIIKQFS